MKHRGDAGFNGADEAEQEAGENLERSREHEEEALNKMTEAEDLSKEAAEIEKRGEDAGDIRRMQNEAAHDAGDHLIESGKSYEKYREDVEKAGDYKERSPSPEEDQ